MAYQHGVYINEQATSVTAPVEVDSAVQVVIGTAPVNRSQESDLLAPKIAYTYDEAKAAVGYSKKFSDFTLCQAISASFLVYNVAPIVLINVLDPKKHMNQVKAEAVTLKTGNAVISKEGILADSVALKSGSGESAEIYTAGKDYVLSFDDDGYLTISALEGGTLAAGISDLTADYSILDPSKVTKDDIIAGIDKVTQVYPMFGIVPGQLLAPKWSAVPEVYAALTAKSSGLNGLFKNIVVADLDPAAASTYDKVEALKNQNGMTDENRS
jgi:uncharacterized protein